MRFPQSFFTFLPVCSAGFPFAIHCNMVLTASRQQIHQDSAWNLWLRDQLAGTTLPPMFEPHFDFHILYLVFFYNMHDLTYIGCCTEGRELHRPDEPK